MNRGMRPWFSALRRCAASPVLSLSMMGAFGLGVLGLAGLGSAQESATDFDLSEYPHQLVFEAYEDDNWDLYVIHADGTQRRALTTTSDRHEMYPQVSPDGKRICFLCDVQRDGDTIRSVEVMNLDGSERRVVCEQARQPCWSPDGTQIAFVKQEFDRFNIKDYVSKGLYIYDLESGQTRAAGNDQVHHVYTLNWAPNGGWIVSTVHGGMGFGHAIIAYEIDGDRVIDLGVSGCRPSLNRDGTRITWSSDDHTVNVGRLEWSDAGVKLVDNQVLHHEDKLHTYHPDWSPDDQFVVFSLGPGGRVRAQGPGTHTEVAEMVGVRGEWELVLKSPAHPEQPPIKVTHGPGSTSKEADWLPSLSDLN